VLTGITVVAGITVPTVGDEGKLPDSLPFLALPDVPLTLQTLGTIAPYALGVAFVGLMESLMTAKPVDDITDTHSDKTREYWGQGLANIVTGFFGGMGGCAMIGQTMINVKSGARTRLSTFLAGVFLLTLVVALGDVVAIIPMAALVATMIFVSVATFDWYSLRTLRTLRTLPRSETAAMLATVAVVVSTDQPGHRRRSGRAGRLRALRAAHRPPGRGHRDQFDYAGDPAEVLIDLSGAQVWDASTVAALDAITHTYETRGKTATVVGFSDHSADRYDRHTGQLSGGH
jgi:SulP family sulfate permease